MTTIQTSTISGLPDGAATTPLTGNELVPMDQGSKTPYATTQDIADLALADDDAARTALGLNTDDSPTFDDLTLTGLLTAPHIHGSLAGDIYLHVKNTSGGSLAANTAVYATGSVGDTDRIEVAACDPTDPTKMPAIGLIVTALANNGEGDAIILGELRPTNTGSYTLGDELYVGAGGALVNTIPASGTVQRVGSVARVQSESGTIVVGIGAGMSRVGFTGAYDDLSGAPSGGTEDIYIIACSDETTALTTGTAKVTFRMPAAGTLTGVKATVTTAPAGSDLIVDINEAGTSVLSTKLSIDDGEKTSETAATPPVISDSALADDAEITIDIDQVGSGTAGAGLKITLYVTRS